MTLVAFCSMRVVPDVVAVEVVVPDVVAVNVVVVPEVGVPDGGVVDVDVEVPDGLLVAALELPALATLAVVTPGFRLAVFTPIAVPSVAAV